MSCRLLGYPGMAGLRGSRQAFFASKPSRQLDDVLDAQPLVTQFEQGARWSQVMRAGGEERLGATLELIGTFAQGKMEPALLAIYSPGSRRYATIREDVIQVAEEFNDTGEFRHLSDSSRARW